MTYLKKYGKIAPPAAGALLLLIGVAYLLLK
jgi:hypothetical protein